MPDNRSESLRYLFITALVAVVAYFVYLLSPILTPFLISALLAYMADPVVDRLEQWRVPRTLAVVIVFILIALIVLVVVLVLFPIFQRQILGFVPKIPGYVDWIEKTAAPWLQQQFGQDMPKLDVAAIKEQLMKHWQQLGNWAGIVLAKIMKSGALLLGWLLSLALIPIVTFYLLRDWDIVVDRIYHLFSPKLQPRVKQFAQETDEVLASFFRGQLLVMLALSLLYSVGLSILGLDLATPIGVMAGMVSFVPYLGFIIGLLSAGAAALMQFQDPTILLWVLVVFMVGQLLESFVLTPRLVGDRIGLHPVAVIFSVMAGGQLFGFFGILLALPVAAVLNVLFRQLLQHYQKKPGTKRRPKKTRKQRA